MYNDTGNEVLYERRLWVPISVHCILSVTCCRHLTASAFKFRIPPSTFHLALCSLLYALVIPQSPFRSPQSAFPIQMPLSSDICLPTSAL